MPVTTAQPTVNPELIVHFVRSVQTVLSTMVGVQTRVGAPHLKVLPVPSYDVSGIIGFSGGVVGSMVVSFQKEAAVKLATRFAGVEMSPDSADFADAIGELANMIAGNAKKDLGAIASISIPNVIIGAGHHIARLADVPCVVIPCQTEVGDFAVEVSIKQLPQAQ
ncbi:MAG: chemotaxis protein CheX [Phycisphaerae bacterium]